VNFTIEVSKICIENKRILSSKVVLDIIFHQ
jgi:hypothetical protein